MTVYIHFENTHFVMHISYLARHNNYAFVRQTERRRKERTKEGGGGVKKGCVTQPCFPVLQNPWVGRSMHSSCFTVSTG